MNTTLIILLVTAILMVSYWGVYRFFLQRRERKEQKIVSIFLEKTSKIPAIIEVMRPYVADPEAFGPIITLHSEAMICRYDTLYDLLEHNARIEHEFSFLMKLSMQIPQLQKDQYFLYIRDFIMRYERDMKKNFTYVNTAIKEWNRFVTLKNMTGIGLIFPGSKKETIR